MTHSEAVKFKSDFGDTFFDSKFNKEMKVIISPSIHDDFIRLITDIEIHRITDIDAVKYSSNNDFEIMAVRVEKPYYNRFYKKLS